MSELPQREENQRRIASPSPATALVLWTLGQLLLLAAIWADVPISANLAHTAGQLGPPFLLAGQLILSAALVADIARTPRLTAMAFAITFPITQLAGWQCSAGAGVSLLHSALLAIWFAGLLCWMQTARSERAKHLIAAALMLWVVGTPMLWYLLADFAPQSAVQNLIAAGSPLMILSAAPHLLIVLAAHTAIAATCAAIARWRQKVAQDAAIR